MQKQSNSPRLIVHGGAWNIPADYHAAHLAGVKAAVEQTYPHLLDGASALDAVEMAVQVLEADPTFDAGRGAFLNAVGEVELDAIIMDGRTLNFGAVAALQNILHPVGVARQVMEQTEHNLLVGAGALDFARRSGFNELPPEELLTERELEFFRQIQNDPAFRTHHPFKEGPGDTVGAVAMDKAGNLAVATSTGGTARKLPGRVGDCPIVGAGAYADNERGAVSATGWGESIMKVLLSKTVCDAFAAADAMAAARQGIDTLARKVNGLGGVIGINAKGEYAWAHNTPYMAMAYAETEGAIKISIRARTN
ncbi:MAG: isoaspartyl peptidase/L-asparaginase [Lewinellaceae bacterium]|nr:isoaspartyl peptidase/L-asparaginase [Lewinellaceae bacterium]